MENILILEPTKEIKSFYKPVLNLKISAKAQLQFQQNQLLQNKQRLTKSQSSSKMKPPIDVSTSSAITTPVIEIPKKVTSVDQEYNYKPVKTAERSRMQFPSNLYPIITQITDEFWNMDFEPQEVSFAFFATITSSNCHEFGISQFADESCSLAVIKVPNQ